MTNYEHYKEKLDLYSICVQMWGANKEGIIPCCTCGECIFNSNNRAECFTTCFDAKAAWLNEEYKNPEIDWNKVPMGTKISVSQNGEYWVNRYFYKFQDGLVYVWNNGATNWSVENDDFCSTWKFAKLAEE